MRPPWPCGTSARLLYQICLAEAWRQDGVVDASSGVVHASLEASQDRRFCLTRGLITHGFLGLWTKSLFHTLL